VFEGSSRAVLPHIYISHHSAYTNLCEKRKTERNVSDGVECANDTCYSYVVYFNDSQFLGCFTTVTGITSEFVCYKNDKSPSQKTQLGHSAVQV